MSDPNILATFFPWYDCLAQAISKMGLTPRDPAKTPPLLSLKCCANATCAAMLCVLHFKNVRSRAQFRGSFVVQWPG